MTLRSDTNPGNGHFTLVLKGILGGYSKSPDKKKINLCRLKFAQKDS